MSGLTGRDYCLVSAAISSLVENPYQPGCKKLKGYHDRYRIRAGNYRIIYRILDAELVIDVVEIGNRKDVYD